MFSACLGSQSPFTGMMSNPTESEKMWLHTHQCVNAWQIPRRGSSRVAAESEVNAVERDQEGKPEQGTPTPPVT